MTPCPLPSEPESLADLQREDSRPGLLHGRPLSRGHEDLDGCHCHGGGGIHPVHGVGICWLCFRFHFHPSSVPLSSSDRPDRRCHSETQFCSNSHEARLQMQVHNRAGCLRDTFGRYTKMELKHVFLRIWSNPGDVVHFSTAVPSRKPVSGVRTQVPVFSW